jgi:hypothetical protein
MKKLLFGAIVLFIFSLSLLIIQTSCSKSEAQTSSAINQLNKLIFTTGDRKFWMCNYDGSNVTQINLALSSGHRVQSNIGFAFVLSPDGQKVFFNTSDANGNLVICSTDNSGNGFAQIIVSSPQMLDPVLLGAY